MAIVLANNWWALALRGVIAVLFGVLTWIWPALTLGSLVLLFGAYVLLDGIFSVLAALKAPQGHQRWWVLLIEGVVGIAVGVLTFLWPGVTGLVLLYLVGAWAILTGVLEIAAAIRLRKHIRGEWFLALSGVASLLFGLLVMVAPIAGALAIALWIGAYAIVFGLLLLALAFRLRRLRPSLMAPGTIVR